MRVCIGYPSCITNPSLAMGVLSIFILSKAGGLIYHKDFGFGLKKLNNSNDYLVIAGTFHSVHALTTRVNPLNTHSSGLLTMEMETCTLHCLQTLTGLKFVVVTDNNQSNVSVVSSTIYEIYSDYVMKNPFYTLDMPIRCHKFDRALNQYISTVE